MKKIRIVGGGAAGMFAAIFAARNGHEVHVYEKNEKLGKKLYITGKGRCNITNAGDMEDLFAAVVTNPKFLYSSFYTYPNDAVIAFFEELGVNTKIERGNRVFPESDKSGDVIAALTNEMKRQGVHIHLRTEVRAIHTAVDGSFESIVLADGCEIKGDVCFITTGGFSYQTTGSTGDGYRMAKEVGHSVSEPEPALVPLVIQEEYVKELQGLSLRNVTATISDGKKRLYQDFGEMLFTHYGVSGPLILSASSVIGKTLKKKALTLEIDLKPALYFEQLDQRVLRDFEENINRQFKNAVSKLFPSKLIPVMIALSGIDENKKVNEISREERQKFVHLIKGLKMTVTALRGFNEAIITRGGVKVKEVNPATMESKLVPGLYFAGEVLDLDAVTGGYNLQIAWSTAYVAAQSVE